MNDIQHKEHLMAIIVAALVRDTDIVDVVDKAEFLVNAIIERCSVDEKKVEHNDY